MERWREVEVDDEKEKKKALPPLPRAEALACSPPLPRAEALASPLFPSIFHFLSLLSFLFKQHTPHQVHLTLELAWSPMSAIQVSWREREGEF